MQFQKDENVLCFCVPFSIVHYLEYCMLEDSSTKCEMRDMYICVRGMHGETLAGRDLIGMEISTISSQPMKNLILGNEPIRKVCCVMCAVGATMASKPQKFVR